MSTWEHSKPFFFFLPKCGKWAKSRHQNLCFPCFPNCACLTGSYTSTCRIKFLKSTKQKNTSWIFTQHRYLYLWSWRRGMGCRLAFCPVDCSGALLTVKRSWSAESAEPSADVSADSKQNKTNKSRATLFLLLLQPDLQNAVLPLHQIRRSNKSLTRQSQGSNAVHSDMGMWWRCL